MKIVNAFSWGAERQTLSAGTGLGTGPSAVSAAATGLHSTVRVTFDRDMDQRPGASVLGNPDNFHLREKVGGRRLAVTRVDMLDSTHVDLVTEEFPPRVRTYTLLVRNVTDLYGLPVEGGPEPQLEFTSAPGTDLIDASDIHHFWGLVGGFQADSSTGVTPDIDPPYLQNQDPYPGKAIVALDADVILEVIDDDTGVEPNSLLIELDRGDGSWIEVWKNDAPQPGYPGTRTTLPDGYRYWVEHTVPFAPATTHRVRVTASDLATVPNSSVTIYDFQTFDVSGFITIHQTGDGEITLSFAFSMELAGAPGDALRDPASYELTALYLGLPAGTFNPTAVTVVNPTTVKLTVPLTTNGEEYRLEVIGALETSTAASITGAISDYVAVVSMPRVTSVVATGSRTIEVSFSRELQANADLVNPSAYVFSGGLRAEIVERIAPDRVKVTTTAQTLGQSYQLSVKAEP